MPMRSLASPARLRAALAGLRERPVQLGWMAFGVAALWLLVIFLRTAWVCDDAYITFRTVEQLFAGNGATFNAGVRVQAYTHPLWFGLLALLGLPGGAPFVHALLLSLLCAAGIVFTLGHTFRREPWRAALALLLLSCSKSFTDFLTSGLENPLSHLLLALLVAVWWRLGNAEPGPERLRPFRHLAWLGGAALLVRHDLLLLVAPFVLDGFRKVGPPGRRRAAADLALALIPLALWTAFSLLYYGFPFPNTAYAKLNTHIPPQLLLEQGLWYHWALVKWDLPTALLLGTTLVWRVRRMGWQDPFVWALLLTVLYLLRIGGDFMAGRFFSAPLLLAVLLGVKDLPAGPAPRRLALGAALLALYLPLSPWKASPAYAFDVIDAHGISDERGFYFQTASLSAYRTRDPRRPFPDNGWSALGLLFADRAEGPQVVSVMGYIGYHAGPRPFLVDPFGLTDPFLARLSSTGQTWRIGHFRRELPEGYLASLASGENRLKDPDLAAYYAHLDRVVRGPLLDPARLRSIVALNLGRCAPLLAAQRREASWKGESRMLGVDFVREQLRATR